jgi:hypothetical protein
VGIKIEPRIKRVSRNFRIDPKAGTYLDDLAIAYNTTQGRVIEALLNTYGPALMRDAPEGETK